MSTDSGNGGTDPDYATDLESVVMTMEEALRSVAAGLASIHEATVATSKMLATSQALVDDMLAGITPVADAVRQNRLDRLAADDEPPHDGGGDGV